MHLPFFHSVFSRNCFFQIFGSLYVGDPDSTTKCGKIQPLLDHLCGSFAAAFTPSKQIAVDESVISFKGRVSFRQYLKGKPHPWGIKAFVQGICLRMQQTAAAINYSVCVYVLTLKLYFFYTKTEYVCKYLCVCVCACT